MKFRIVCSWCEALIEEGDPFAQTSHGICEACLFANFPELTPAGAKFEGEVIVGDRSALVFTIPEVAH